MFSVMILGVGLIALSSLFPVASAVQKSTFDELMAQQLTTAVDATLRARGVSKADLIATPSYNDGAVHRLPDPTASPYTQGTNIPWILNDRSYPASKPRTYSYGGALGNAENRDFYWEIFFRRDSTTGDWQIFVIVMKRVPNPAAPAVPPQTISDANLSLGEPGINAATGAIVVKGTAALTGNYFHGAPINNTVTTARILQFGNEVVR